MKKKTPKKRKTVATKSVEKPKNVLRTPGNEGGAVEDLDFGGLPKIDFKRNLGCG